MAPRCVPSPVVARRAREMGTVGEAWLAGLDDLVAAMERSWHLRALRPLTGGSAAYVATVRRADGRPAVLKLGLPEEGFADQILRMMAAGGRGYATVYDADIDRHALLLEPLGAPLDAVGVGPETQIDALAALLEQAWLTPTSPGAARQDKAAWLAGYIADLRPSFEHLVPAHVFDTALGGARARSAAFRASAAVAVHGDAHPGNALALDRARPGAETGFVFVDPDGWSGDPAYDLGVALRDFSAELLGADLPAARLRSWCARIAAPSGIDAADVWEWAYVERVSTALALLSLGEHAQARQLLAVAEELTGP